CLLVRLSFSLRLTQVHALIPYDAYARFHNLGHGREALAGLLAELRALGKWRKCALLRSRYERNSASPNAARALARTDAAIDVRSVLPTIRVPTLGAAPA